MSSSIPPRPKGSYLSRISPDEFQSIADSEDVFNPSSTLQAPKVKSISLPTPGPNGAIPPPLPPKPAFARAPATASVSSNAAAPPPLPPKPDHVRAAAIEDLLSPQPHTISAPPFMHLHGLDRHVQAIPPPTRPLPPVPPVAPLDTLPQVLADRMFFDDDLPPEPTVVSEGADPIRITTRDSLQPASEPFSEHLPKWSLPLPPPPYPPTDHPITLRLHSLRSAPDAPVHVANTLVQLSSECAEDVNIGALVLGRSRLKDVCISPPPKVAPISWRQYKPTEPGDDVWHVLREYLTNVALKSHGRTRALQLLTGYVVGACLESTDAGIKLLAEIVRRMRGAERSERDGSIFTLLINVAAHVSFVLRVSRNAVEQVTRYVFSQVVEQMHGRQDDEVMWQRALRCFLILLKSSDQLPSNDMSTKSIVALALHVGDLMHADVDHVLITNALCPRLRQGQLHPFASLQLDLHVLEHIGGIHTVCTLFVNTTSTSARHSLFQIIFDVAVIDTLESVPLEDRHALRDQYLIFRALLQTYDAADLFVHAFRVGPSPTFVIDVIRLLLLKPLAEDSYKSLSDSQLADDSTAARPSFQELNENINDGKELVAGIMYRAPASEYLASVRTMVKFLDRSFCLKILQGIEIMAEDQSAILLRRENMHHPREWKLLREVAGSIQKYIFSLPSNKPVSLEELLTKIHSATVEMTSARTNLRGIVKMSEVLIEFFTMKMPFSKHKEASDYHTCTDSVAKLFLRGQLVLTRELLDKANPEIFTSLLLASRQRVPLKRVSECRQCFVEFLGVSKERVHLLRDFADDDDAAVAYRSSENVSKYSDIVLQSRSLTGGDGDEDV